jgi:hypothetical protein
VTIGGPVFLMPENLGLIFIPLALIFAFQLTKIRPLYNYIGLFLVLVFLLYSHPPTALVLLMILFFYLLLLLFSKDKNDPIRAKYIFVVMVLAVIFSMPNYLLDLESRGANAITFGLPIFTGSIWIVYGILQTILFIVGIYLFSKTSNREVWSLILGALSLFLVIFLFVNFKINYVLPYQKAYMPLFLLMSIIASYAYASVLKLPGKWKRIGYALFAILIIATIFLSVNNDLATPTYHLITNQDYQNFLFIKAHFNNNDIAIMDPYIARAYTPITGMRVYSVEPFGPSSSYAPLLSSTDAFFTGNCTNTAFLRANNISIVYTNMTCQNSDLVRVNNDTYALNTSKTP